MATKEWSFGRSIFFTGVVLAAGLLVDQLVGCMSAPAQQPSSLASSAGVAAPATADELIRQMSRAATVIFAGEVLEVRHPVGFAGSPEDAAAGAVEIDFRVELAVLGVQRDSIFTLREWSGLWIGGIDRYHAGQRLLMLLRPPNPAGFTAPVHGSEGAIPLRGVGTAPGPYESSSAPAQWMVDVRWLQAQTSRQARTPAPPVGSGVHSELAASDSGPVEPFLVHALPGPWILQNNPVPDFESLSHVLGLCGSPVGPKDAQ